MDEEARATLGEDGKGRKLAAIMFTDIVGYTALTQTDEALALEVLEKHNKLLRPFFPRYYGREVKTIGDSFLVEFDSALDATLCAIEIQKFLHDYNISTREDWKIKLRIGIHLGDVIREGRDILGDAVNIASRIQPLSDAEGVCVSQQVFDQVHNKISYSLERLEENPKLKNVKFQTSIYTVVMPWELRARISPTSTLPADLDPLRVAVLPFASLSPDPNDEYFADGMTEELISTMSKIGGLSVIARTSVMVYKGERKKNIREISRELDVGTILEGSVRKAGDKLRITAQLIDCNRADHLWSESYNRELKDVFAIQSEISENVANELKIKLLANEKAQIEKEPTANTEAHILYLKGFHKLINAFTEDDFRKALSYFEGAIQLDPSFALAYSWIGDYYSSIADRGWAPPDEVLPKGEEAIRKALELDPSLAEAHIVLSELRMDRLDWKGAESEIKRALELNQNSAYGHCCYAFLLMFVGKNVEALAEAKRGLELDPVSVYSNITATSALFYLKNYDQAIEYVKKMQEFGADQRQVSQFLGRCYLAKSLFDQAIQEFQKAVDPSKGKADLNRSGVAVACAFSGRTDEARSILEDFKEVAKTQYLPLGVLARIYAALDEREEAMRLLEDAYQRRDFSVMFDLRGIYSIGAFDKFRSDPRFIALAKKVALEQ